MPNAIGGCWAHWDHASKGGDVQITESEHGQLCFPWLPTPWTDWKTVSSVMQQPPGNVWLSGALHWPAQRQGGNLPPSQAAPSALAQGTGLLVWSQTTFKGPYMSRATWCYIIPLPGECLDVPRGLLKFKTVSTEKLYSLSELIWCRETSELNILKTPGLGKVVFFWEQMLLSGLWWENRMWGIISYTRWQRRARGPLIKPEMLGRV